MLLGIKNLVVEVFQAIITWAVAGRHVEKLKIILEKAEKVSGKYWCLDGCICLFILFKYLQANLLLRMLGSLRLMLLIQIHLLREPRKEELFSTVWGHTGMEKHSGPHSQNC